MNYAKIIENSSQGICVILENGTVTYANNALRKLLEVENLTNFFDFIHPDDKDKIKELGKNPAELKFLTKSGKLKYTRCYVNSVAWELRPAWQFFVVDISDTIKTINEQKIVVDTIIDNVEIGLFKTTTDGNLIYANKYFCEIFNEHFEDLKQAQYKEFFIESCCCLQEEEVCNWDTKIILKSGDVKWVRINTKRIDNNGFVGTIQDITKNKVYLPQLLKLRDEIKREKLG